MSWLRRKKLVSFQYTSYANTVMIVLSTFQPSTLPVSVLLEFTKVNLSVRRYRLIIFSTGIKIIITIFRTAY